jgi:uncharacterized protein
VASPSVRLALRDQTDAVEIGLVISELPGRRALVHREDGTHALREASNYHYAFEGCTGPIRVEPAELFDADPSGLSGRLRTGQSVGRLAIEVRTVAGQALRCSLEVEPVKLDQQSEYRQMLQDISSHATDAILQGFAPTTLELTPSELPPELLYQRFAVIGAFLNDLTFDGALARVLNQPYRSWELVTERRRAGAAFPSGSAFRRALAVPGPRVAWTTSTHPRLSSLPSYLDREQHEESLDNAPNRFVKFVLNRWLSTALELLSA